MKSKLLIASCLIASSTLFAQSELVQNGTCDDFNVTGDIPGTTANVNDNADAFDMTPPSSVIDNAGDSQPSPYGWSNTDLDAWLETAYGDDSEQPGSTSDGSFDNGTKTRGVKIGEASRRLYQEVDVVQGESYEFSILSRAEALAVDGVTPITTEVFLLNTAISNETGLTSSSPTVDAYLSISDDFSTDKEVFKASSTTFTASTNKVIIYVKAELATTSANEVFYDNISLIGDAPLSTNELSATDFAIYPNPATDVLNIDSKIEISSVSIYNLLGATVYSSNNFNGVADVSGLNSGVYILKVESNGKTLSKKLVIQ